MTGPKGAVTREQIYQALAAVLKGAAGTLNPPAAPALGSVAGGALAATTYYVKLTYVNQFGETIGSAEASLAVGNNNLLTVTSPSASGANAGQATGYNVYASTVSGAETKQNAGPIALGTNWTEPVGGLVAGSPLPTVNTATLAVVTRKPVSIDQIGSMQTPAVWMEQVPQDYTPHEPNLPTVVKLKVDASIALSQPEVVEGMGAETYIPAADINNLLDNLDAVLQPDWPLANFFTLGGLVFWCRIIGQVVTDDRTFNGKLLIIVPFEMLVTQ